VTDSFASKQRPVPVWLCVLAMSGHGFGGGGYGGSGGYGGRGGGRGKARQHFQQPAYDPVREDTLRIREFVMRNPGSEKELRDCATMLVKEFDDSKWAMVRANARSERVCLRAQQHPLCPPLAP